VSSFQLDHADTFRPKVAVLLNITPDHLDRYGLSFEKYRSAKSGIFRRQGEGDWLVFNADDPETIREVHHNASGSVTRLPFSLSRPLEKGAWIDHGMICATIGDALHEIVPVNQLGIPGAHNQYNALASILTALALGVDPASIRKTLKAFAGVEHRLEFVREVHGVKYVNDSKATNVDSVWYALQSYETPIVLMLGGRDKGNDYSRLYSLVDRHVRAIVAIGESSATVVRAFEGRKPVTVAENMVEAVSVSASLAHTGDVVLLSPACASFDWFDNYEHRGRIFKELVRSL
jgi:UDP-N-acetylmuramoylalanine--D-glutamate ligase